MNMKVIIAVFFLISVALVKGESGLGGCPSTIVSQAAFDAESYFGLWYEVARYNYTFESDGVCSTAHYNLSSDGSYVVVVNRERYGSVDGPFEQAVGEATIPDPKNYPAQLQVKFNSAPFSAPYWVVDTDYKTYSMVWSCTDLGLFHLDYAWILSRTPIMDPTLLSSLVNKWETLGLDTSYFYFTTQKGCTY